MKKPILAIAVVFVLGLVAVRIFYVNNTAEKVEKQSYGMNEWVEIGDDFIETAEENAQGYQVMIEDAKLISYSDFIKKYDKPEDYLAPDSRHDVVNLRLKVKNQGSKGGFIFVKRYVLIGKDKNYFVYYDPDLLALTEPKIGKNFAFAIREGTEHTVELPFPVDIDKEEFLKQQPFQLAVTAYPVKKVISINLEV